MIEDKFINIDTYSKDQAMYRYLEIEQLIFLITEKSFPLSRMTLFNDPFEGSYPRKFIEIEKQDFKQTYGNSKPKDYRNDKENFIKNSKAMEYDWRRNFFVSCWHANNSESEAMWRLYSNYKKGIAIQTDLNTLLNELPSEYDNQGFKSKINIAEVKYIDFNNPKMNLFRFGFVETYLLKRKAFDYEKEVRIFTHLGCGWGNKETGVVPEIENDVILLKLDLNKIIKKIIIAPNSPSWYRKLIMTILDKFDFDLEVENSSLAEKPCHVFWAHIGILDEN